MFSDVAYGASNHNAAVQIAGGAATIKQSLFWNNDLGLQLTGGSTTVTDSTFNRDSAGISSAKVAFKIGTIKLCSAKAVNGSGPATCETTDLPAGTPTVTAAFRSTSPYLNSTGTATPVVGTVPKFTSDNTAEATIGKHKTIKLHASGAPTPTITRSAASWIVAG